jgi:hypothetical protein
LELWRELALVLGGYLFRDIAQIEQVEKFFTGLWCKTARIEHVL